MAQRIKNALGGHVGGGGGISIWGITFKAETDELRESPSLVILPFLQEKGALLRIYDPKGTTKRDPVFQGVSCATILMKL